MANRKLTVPKKYKALFDRDEKRFGREVAVYNLGWLRGDESGAKRARRRERK